MSPSKPEAETVLKNSFFTFLVAPKVEALVLKLIPADLPNNEENSCAEPIALSKDFSLADLTSAETLNS